MQIGSFIQGAVDGQMWRRAKEADAADQKLREEDLALRKQQAAQPQDWGGQGGDYALNGGKPVAVGDPALASMDPYQKSFLNAIAAGESGGKYDIRYTPKGGASFSGFDKHPGIMEPGPEGPSSAAGRYQFTKSTWDDMGGGAFTPQRQDVRAWTLATSRYKATTGRDLDADLHAGGLDERIIGSLSPTWTSLRSGGAKAAATFQDSLKRYSVAPTGNSVAAAREDDQPTWGNLRRIVGA